MIVQWIIDPILFRVESCFLSLLPHTLSMHHVSDMMGARAADT